MAHCSRLAPWRSAFLSEIHLLSEKSFKEKCVELLKNIHTYLFLKIIVNEWNIIIIIVK